MPADVSGPALVLFGESLQAFVETMPRKQRERFLTRLTARMRVQRRLAEVCPIRPGSTEPKPEDRTAAADWFDSVLPGLVAALDR